MTFVTFCAFVKLELTTKGQKRIFQDGQQSWAAASRASGKNKVILDRNDLKVIFWVFIAILITGYFVTNHNIYKIPQIIIIHPFSFSPLSFIFLTFTSTTLQPTFFMIISPNAFNLFNYFSYILYIIQPMQISPSNPSFPDNCFESIDIQVMQLEFVLSK